MVTFSGGTTEGVKHLPQTQDNLQNQGAASLITERKITYLGHRNVPLQMPMSARIQYCQMTPFRIAKDMPLWLLQHLGSAHPTMECTPPMLSSHDSLASIGQFSSYGVTGQRVQRPVTAAQVQQGCSLHCLLLPCRYWVYK